MAEFGILIDYEWCTGCHSCEMACQMEHKFPVGQSGVVVNEVGPWRIEGDRWQFGYLPAFTEQCDLCAARRGLGKQPSCVSHCQARCLEFGELSELSKKLEGKTKQSLCSLG